MTASPALRRSRLGARIVPLIVAMGALPLMAPTCGSPGEGPKTFSRQSLIIPMDVCYQSQADAAGTPTPVACPQTSDPGSVIKAYGLVYQLIRAGVPVYWIIAENKPSLTAVDLTIQYANGAPVLFYDWAAGNPAGAGTPTASHAIDYRGGPFVVDGSDYVKASAVLQQFKGSGGTTLAPAPFQNVNVHVSNVSFRGYAKRTMAGGWSAGGATPPKLALLDIGSSGAGAKNSEFVIQGYLAQAGLDTPSAGGTSAPGAHGQIYDRLFMPDFIPTVAGADWTRTRLYQNGYQILWIPHWAAPSSCATCAAGPSCNQTACDSSRYDPVTISLALKTIGQFVANGKDLFAECAGVGSLEGVVTGTPPNPTGTNATYGTAVVETHLQTGPSPSGIFIETNTPAGAFFRGPFTSPLLQIGDFRFTPASGAISDWKAARYTPAVDPGFADSTTRMIQETPGGDTAWDLFTIRPGFGGKGTVVYLGGHSYSGNDGSFSSSGTRLVLNTLFNLGAGCVASGLACNTGLFGVCSQGVWACDSSGQPFCQQTVFPGPEACNGLDDDCNGAVDEGLVVNCYAPPAGYVDPLAGTRLEPFMATSTVGSCHSGVSSCGRNPDGTFGMSACVGQVLPTFETCNGLDDDCNNAVDDALTRSCYDGPTYTLDFSVDPNGIPKGICAKGSQVCQSGAWGGPLGAGFVPGVCPGEVLPQPEVCPADPSTVTTALDVNCDGAIISCTCTDGQQRACFSGPGTPGVGACRAGTQTCDASGNWGECTGEVVANLFSPEPCTTPAKPAGDPGYVKAADTNCDGRTFQCAECTGTEVQSCYGPDPTVIPSVAGRGQCSWGTRTCNNGAFGPCVGYGFASALEYCDGKDNNCNGPRVASPFTTRATGAIVPAAGASTGAGSPAGTDDNATCPAGSQCLNGVCVAATCGVEVPPPEGYTCNGSGQVIQGTCGVTSCTTGELCRFGTCDNPCPVSMTEVDPDTLQSASLVCAKGTICGGGACIAGGCYETGCPSGELCQGGACVPDACLGKTCPTGTFCRQGDCVQSCTFVTCAAGQKCGVDGFCEPDPCAGKTCAAGQRCVAGVCQANPCGSLTCATGQLCENVDGGATCVDDPCGTAAHPAIRCPVGTCIEGQCFATGSSGGPSGITTSSSGGCGCGAGGSGTGLALPALLALLALPLARRRRGAGGGGALLAALLSLSLFAPACTQKKTETTFDPSVCAETCGEQQCVYTSSDPAHCGNCGTICGAGQQCKGGSCGPTTAVAPYLASLTPATGYKDNDAFVVTLSGERFAPGATVRMATPTGPRTESCPASAGTCQWLSAGSIRLVVDLTGIGPGSTPFTIRVVNPPDGVISNARTLPVDIPRPDIAGVVPSSVVAGTVTPLDVSPTTAADAGFTSGSQCLLKPHGSARPTGPADGTGLPASLNGRDLACQLDASTIAPGSYDLWVVSEPRASGAFLTSTSPAAVTIQASDPVIFSMDPNAGTSTVSLSVTGARFDPSCKVLFDGNVIAGTLYVSDTSLFVPSYVLTTTPGNYAVTVRKNAVAPFLFSNAVTFTVGGNPPAVTSFSPPTAYQGDPAVPLVFTGTGFPANATIELEPPGSTVFSALATTFTACGGSCTRLTATKSLIKSPGVPEPEGTWLARVRLGGPGAPTASPWPLIVLSNQAILRNYTASPAPAQSGVVGSTKASFTLQVSNIHGVGSDFSGVKVFMQGPIDATAQTTRSISLSPVPTAGATSITTVPVTLNVPSGLYALTVNNPNATPSNALTFTVTPGPPTIKNLCQGGTGGATGVTCVPLSLIHQTGTVNITIEGTNFAALDLNGNGSIVMVAADFMPGWSATSLGYDCAGSTGVQPQQVPGIVTVRGPTQIDVAVDTLSAYVDPSVGTNYYVSIWNPSGSGAPLKSGAPNLQCGPPPATTMNPTSLPLMKIVSP